MSETLALRLDRFLRVRPSFPLSVEGKALLVEIANLESKLEMLERENTELRKPRIDVRFVPAKSIPQGSGEKEDK